MLNRLKAFITEQELIAPGDQVVCAVSGGADSVALLWALYLLREKLGIQLSAAHYNHGLRGEESDRDEKFVRDLCRHYDVDLYVGRGEVKAGEKGLEAAARDARYAFLQSLPGKIATAHTADDNAETVLMHMVRGTGLRGLGGIAPKRENLIRPMLTVTRQQVLSFLEEYHVTYVEDGSNSTDAFMRNRLRHHVMPWLRQENPRIAENMSDMALRLRRDEQALEELVAGELPTVSCLRQLNSALRGRYLGAFLQKNGVKEPGAEHILLAERLVFSDNPSAEAAFPGGVRIARNYDRLAPVREREALEERVLSCPGTAELPEVGLRIVCTEAESGCLQTDAFTVKPMGAIRIRCRRAGDTMRLSGGTKSLKELFIDRKIPAHQRAVVPVIADDGGVLGVWGIGANLDRTEKNGPGVLLRFEKIEK